MSDHCDAGSTMLADSGDVRRRWFRGDCHVHSARSTDAVLSPDQLVTAARAVGLDFVAATEHNTTDTRDEWCRAAGPDLLVIPGEEITTQTGHWLALGLQPGRTIDASYSVRDDVLGWHAELVRSAGGATVAAHPYAPYPSGMFAYQLDEMDLVEVWNGPWQADLPWSADNSTATAEWGRRLATGVAAGRWQPAIGNSDTHLAGQIGVPHTVVLAEDLSISAVLDGLRAGRSWIAASRDVEVHVEVTGADQRASFGDGLHLGDDEATVSVEVRGVPCGVLSIHTERGAVHRSALPDNGTHCMKWFTTAHDAMFVRIEVRDRHGQMAALTNPVILMRQREPGMVV